MKVNWGAVRWSFWLGLLAGLIILASLGWAAQSVYRTLMDEQQVPLDAIVIQGGLAYTSTDEVRRALIADEVGSFFGADVDTLRHRVEQLPWVYSASVRKQWPGRLRLYVVEQKPLAIWNGQQLLNHQGQIFSAEAGRVTETLPRLTGPQQDAKEVIRQFERISDVLAASPFQVQELEVTQRFSVSVTLDNGIRLKLGREARLERVQRFLQMYAFLSTQNEREIDYVDLRYDTGVAVGWHEPEK